MTGGCSCHGRLRAAMLILALALVCLAITTGLVARLTWLLVGAVALGYIARSYGQVLGTVPIADESGSHEDGPYAVLASAGHDLRQPVQAISLFAASLAAYSLPESSRKLVAGIETGVQSLSSMLESVCGIAKLRAGRLSCVPLSVALEPFFAHAVEDKLDIAHGIPLHLRHMQTRRHVLADAALLQQALSVLLGVALSQCDADGGILLGCRARGAERWVELRYTGAQARSQTEHVAVFTPGESYCEGLPDKGYGLAYVQGLAELMGGDLEAFIWPHGSLLRLRLQAA